MKTRHSLLVLACLCALPLSAQLPEGSASAPDQQKETRMLHHLLKMPPEELAALRQTIERIERMTPEEKALLRDRIARLEDMPPERIQAMRQRYQAIDPETRVSMRQRWLEMTPEARREWRQKLRELTHEERDQVFKEQGFLPAPGKPPKGDKPPPPEAQ